MKLNQYIIHRLAKVAKKPVIKEKTRIILRKTNVKRIFVNKNQHFVSLLHTIFVFAFSFWEHFS